MVLGPETIRLRRFCRANRGKAGQSGCGVGSGVFTCRMLADFALFRALCQVFLDVAAKSALPKPSLFRKGRPIPIAKIVPKSSQIVPKAPPPQTVRRKSYSNERLLTPKFVKANQFLSPKPSLFVKANQFLSPNDTKTPKSSFFRKGRPIPIAEALPFS